MRRRPARALPRALARIVRRSRWEAVLLGLGLVLALAATLRIESRVERQPVALAALAAWTLAMSLRLPGTRRVGQVVDRRRGVARWGPYRNRQAKARWLYRADSVCSIAIYLTVRAVIHLVPDRPLQPSHVALDAISLALLVIAFRRARIERRRFVPTSYVAPRARRAVATPA
jgi:hypothetical protein